MDRSKFLQTSHLPEAEHGALSPSKWEVTILGTVVHVLSNLLALLISNHLHRGPV